jgi:hypothetical protein
MIFYLHIPKTGGQTLSVRLASAFLPDQTYFLQDDLNFPRDVEKLRSFKKDKAFVEAHVGGRMLEDHSGMDLLVPVRDPIEQMISNWRHIRREPKSPWHRPAKILHAGDFFDRFGDFFRDHQTNYMLSSFTSFGIKVEREGYHKALLAAFSISIDKFRWIVPTPSIDEFITLWSLETKRTVPNAHEVVNVAAVADADALEAKTALLERPSLYSYDSLLYQIAVSSFADYRKRTLELLAPWSFPDDSRRAFHAEGSGIWLSENWHDPERASLGLAWWSGPTRRSEVRFRRKASERYLCFDVVTVNGISYGDITVWAKNGFVAMKAERRERPSGDGMSYCVPISSLAEEDGICLLVPDCMASIMTNKNDNSLVRRAFLATNWSLRSDPV